MASSSRHTPAVAAHPHPAPRSEKAADLLPDPPEVGLAEPAAGERPVPHPLPLPEQDVGEHQQILADRRPGVPPVDHGLEVPAKVSPADLPLGPPAGGRRPGTGRSSAPPAHRGSGRPAHRARDRRTRNTVTLAVTATHSQPRLRPSRHPVSSTFAGFPATWAWAVPDDRFQGGGRLPLEVAHGGRADRHPEQVAAEPGDAPLADPVRPAEQGAHRLDPRPVPAPGVGRQGRAGDPPAPRAGQPVAAVLGDVRADRRDLDHLVPERLGVIAGERVASSGRRCSARSSTTVSGGRSGRVRLGCPGCPPFRFPLGVLGGAGLACGGSEDGGLDEFEESWPSRASRSASRASRYRMYACTAGGRASNTSGGSEGGVMPPEGIREPAYDRLPP